MKTNNNIPAYRFQGYTDAWEPRRFSELAEIRRGLTYSPTSIRKEGIRVLRSSNIDEDTFTFGEDDVFVDKGVVKIPLVKEGDILITAANGSSRLVGKHTIIKGLPANSTVHGGFMLLASCGNPEFVNSLMSSEWYNKFISLYVAGGNGAIGNLNKNDLDVQLVVVPSTSEQSVIGTFFSTLDQQITLHQRKLDTLKEQKKTYLKLLFSAKGQTKPVLRFQGFEDDWEEVKLGEVAKFRRGSFPQPYGNSEWYDGDGAMPFVQVADVTDDMNLVSDTKQKISKKAQPLSVYAEKGSVLVTLQGSIGRVAITQYGAYIDRTVLIFENFNLPIDNLFWAYVVKQKFIEEAKSAPGGTIKTITKEVLSNFEIKLPKFPEQEAIGTFFQTLDQEIAQVEDKLASLKEMKKTLLRKLFV